MKRIAPARAVLPQECQAFARFERDNRGTYERFNEPNPDGYYTDRGLREAFDELLALERRDRVLSRAVPDGAHGRRWLGRGLLFMGDDALTARPLLAYQTDRRHLGRGVASALLADLIATARARGVRCVDAVVTEDNAVSRHMLVRSGFECIGFAEPAALRHGTVSCLLFRLFF